MDPPLCWLNDHHLPVMVGTSGAYRELPTPTLAVGGEQRLWEWVTSHQWGSQLDTGLPNETQKLLNYSNSCTSQVMFLQAFSWVAFLSGNSGTAVPRCAESLMEDPWCSHPRHPCDSAKCWVLYYGDTDLSKLSSPALIISAPWGHTPPCHCPTN